MSTKQASFYEIIGLQDINNSLGPFCQKIPGSTELYGIIIESNLNRIITIPKDANLQLWVYSREDNKWYQIEKFIATDYQNPEDLLIPGVSGWDGSIDVLFVPFLPEGVDEMKIRVFVKGNIYHRFDFPGEEVGAYCDLIVRR
jgi:hypothetical protein